MAQDKVTVAKRTVRELVGERLKRRRLRAGKTQGEVAAALGLSPSQWSAIERGDERISTAQLARASYYLWGKPEIIADLEWCEVENTLEVSNPPWQRTAGLAAGGSVFVPAMLSGGEVSEVSAFTRAVFQGVAVATKYDHVYLPAVWMARAYPALSGLCNLIEVRVRAHFGAGALEQHRRH
jgi:transcriptional regulator with XRE-family HTH domain